MARHEARSKCLRTTLILTPIGLPPSARRSGARSGSRLRVPPPTGWRHRGRRCSAPSPERAESPSSGHASRSGTVVTPRGCVSRAGSPPGSGTSWLRAPSSRNSPSGPQESRPLDGESPGTPRRPDTAALPSAAAGQGSRSRSRSPRGPRGDRTASGRRSKVATRRTPSRAAAATRSASDSRGRCSACSTRSAAA